MKNAITLEKLGIVSPLEFINSEFPKSSHICISDCGKTKDCPLCIHGYDDETFCMICDKDSVDEQNNSRVGE